MTSAGSSRTISAGSESRSHSVIRNSPVEMSIQARAGDRHQIIVALGVEEGVFGERAGRHQADHVAPHYSFGAALLRFCRVLELLAHCDAMAERNQAVQVLIGTLNWHAAHRDVLAEMLAALGEHDAERARGGFGVFKEHFVEVAHPVEQDAIRIGRLDLDVLLHHRSYEPFRWNRGFFGLWYLRISPDYPSFHGWFPGFLTRYDRRSTATQKETEASSREVNRSCRPCHAGG